MYRRFPDKEWYFVAGCDTYLNLDNVLRMLEEFDSSEDHWIAKSRYPDEPMPAGVGLKLENWPDYKSRPSAKDASIPGYTWTSGAWSWFLSNSVAKRYADNLDRFLAEVDSLKICYCPDKVTGLFLNLLGYDITPIPGKWNKGYQHCAPDTKASPVVDMYDYSLAHYMTPRKMMALHERALHEKADRLRSNATALASWQNELRELHQTTLMRKQNQMIAIGVSFHLSDYKLPDAPGKDPLEELHNIITSHLDALRDIQVDIRTHLSKRLPKKEFKPYDIPLSSKKLIRVAKGL